MSIHKTGTSPAGLWARGETCRWKVGQLVKNVLVKLTSCTSEISPEIGEGIVSSGGSSTIYHHPWLDWRDPCIFLKKTFRQIIYLYTFDVLHTNALRADFAEFVEIWKEKVYFSTLFERASLCPCPASNLSNTATSKYRLQHECGTLSVSLDLGSLRAGNVASFCPKEDFTIRKDSWKLAVESMGRGKGIIWF